MKKIKKIKNSFLSRNLSLSKIAIKGGIQTILNQNNPTKIIEGLIGKNSNKFISGLSHYKGVITKSVQIISQYGEFYLSDDVKQSLRKVLSQGHYVDFSIIKKQLTDEMINELEIDEAPLAAASIGQVHKAIIRKSGEVVVLKIQYPGIKNAIKGDILFLKLFFKSLKIFPRSVDTTDIFISIEKMLRDEINYEREKSILKKYASLINDDFFIVPRVYDRFSNSQVLCLEFFPHNTLFKIFEEKENNFLDIKKINKLGEKIFELFLKELFEIHIVQSDAHGGNYLLPNDLKKLCLIDFGACHEFDQETLRFYTKILESGFLKDKQSFLETFKEFLHLKNIVVECNEELLWSYILLASSPLRDESYHWGKSRLPDQLLELGNDLRKGFKINKLPSDFIFIDRKVLGVFTLLHSIGSEFSAKEVFLKFINSKSRS